MIRALFDHGKVTASWVVVLPQAVVLFAVAGLFAYSAVAQILLWSGSGESSVLSRAAGILLWIFLMAYYGLPSLFGGLYTFLCLLLHLWAWRQAMAMGGLKWLFVITFFVSVFYAGYFVWWHLTGQQFGYL